MVTIPRVAPKKSIAGVMKLNKGLCPADHSGDRVVFLGTIVLTGKALGGTHHPHFLPVQGLYPRPSTRKTPGHSGNECSRHSVEAGWLAQPNGLYVSHSRGQKRGRRQGSRRWSSRAAKGGRVGKAKNGQSHLDPRRMGRCHQRVPHPMTRPQRHPRRPARPRPRRRSSTWKPAPGCSTTRSSIWPPSTWRPPIVIVISSSRQSGEMLDAYLEGAGQGQAGSQCGAGRRRPADDRGRPGGHRRDAPGDADLGTPLRAPPPRASDARALRPRRPSKKPCGCSTGTRSNSCGETMMLAQGKVDEVRSLDIQWGLFDDTPDKLQAEIAKTPAQVADRTPRALTPVSRTIGGRPRRSCARPAPC